MLTSASHMPFVLDPLKPESLPQQVRRLLTPAQFELEGGIFQRCSKWLVRGVVCS